MLKNIWLLGVLGLIACSTTPSKPQASNDAPLTMPEEVVVSTKKVLGLEDRIWQLVELPRSVNVGKIQDGAFINFEDASMNVKGSTGCNRLMGSYKRHENILRLNDIASTKIFCPSGGIVQEALFIDALNDTRAWRIDGTHLYLMDDKNTVLAVFEVQ
ncbi:MAG: META domain-containing protein [Moraxellaceae bacterium]|nr:META domain-containing protein [Moraxellaceae bacterium]